MKKIKEEGLTTWENKHQTFTDTIQAFYHLGNDVSSPLREYNATTKGIQQILSEAVRTNTPVRALGSGWSWSKVAHVNGIMLNTQPLNSIFPISDESVSPAYKGRADDLFFVQCGNAVWELSRYLKNINRSLKTTGASNGQTIAGVVSTGAHGSAINFGSIPEFVVGLHLIVSPERHIYLERKSYPVANKAFVDKLQAEWITDDDLFNAALVSFGSCGIIHGLMIETEELYLLETYRQRIKYDDALLKIMETLDFSNANFPPHGNEVPFHFGVTLNQFDMENGAYVTTMYKRPYRTDYPRPVIEPDKIGPGDDATALGGKISDLFPKLTPILLNRLIPQFVKIIPPDAPVIGTTGEIFSNTELRGKIISAGTGIQTKDIKRVVQLLLDQNKETPYAGIIATRFVKKSTATLGFTKFNPTCIIELDGPYSKDAFKFFNTFWQQLDDQQIPYTLHWGKVSELNPQRIQKMYGESLDAWKAARNKLLGPSMIKIFSNSLTQKWGID